MTVRFWKGFSKRYNSTLRPSVIATAELTGCLKDNTSVHDPVLQIATNEFGYIYAYINDFDKYYFVRDVVSIANGLCEYHLIEDSLASHKDDIGATIAHIAYSSAGYNPDVIDPRIAVSNTKSVLSSGGASSDFRVFPSSGGNYILSVFYGRTVFSETLDKNINNGMAITYFLNDADMYVIRKFLGNSMSAINTYMHGEPLKAVFNCLWVPYNLIGNYRDLDPEGILRGFVDSDQNIIGYHPNVPMIGDQVGTTSLFSDKALILANFPKYTNTIKVRCHLRYTDFRSYEPYTTGNIYLPGVGTVNLNMGDWTVSDYINVEYTLEYATGNIRYFLKTDAGVIIQTFDCCVATQCPLGQQVLDGAGVIGGMSGMVGGAAALAAGIATGGSGAAIAGGALSMMMGAANTALAANRRDVMTTGNLGSRMVQTQPFIIHTEFAVNSEGAVGDDYIAERGRPYSGTAQISSMTSNAGNFIQCEGASINCAASALEKEEINNFLNNGFYYE